MTQPIENLEQLRAIDRELGERLGVQGEISWCVVEPEANGWIVDKDRSVWTRWPKFSTDGNAMLLLIELMAERGFSLELRVSLVDGRTVALASFCRRPITRTHSYGGHMKVEMAISQAARMALRAEAGE